MFMVTLAVGAATLAEDWTQWRGPNRNGVANASPALADWWQKTGPKLIWQSEKLPSGEAGGLGSPAVADGRVFVYIDWRYIDPIQTRTLPAGGLQQLGWTKDKPPQELLDTIEQFRLSEERAASKPATLDAWLKKWTDENLGDEASRKKHAPWAIDRIKRGKVAFDLDVLEKLAAIKDKQFATQAELDSWYQENAIPEPVKKAAAAHIATTVNRYTDVVMALSASDGKTLWRQEYPGRGFDWGASATPLVADGKVYVVGTLGNVYCHDAKDGQLVWKAQHKGDKNGRISSSLLMLDGKLILLAGPLTVMDPANGEIKWTQPKCSGADPSPITWKSGEKTYVICNSGQGAVCVDPEDGKILWSVPCGNYSSGAVSGDYLALQAENKQPGLSAYKLSLEKPQKLWSVESGDRGTSPVIFDGYVYSVANSGTVCVKLEGEGSPTTQPAGSPASSQPAWKQNVGGGEITSPILADRKVISEVGGEWLIAFHADPARFTQIGKFKIGMATCSSPAFVGGKLYLRMNTCVACYDLTVGANATQPASAPAAEK